MIFLKISTRKIIMIALFAALTAIGSIITIPIGPVPITLQNMFPMLAGLILGSEAGAMSQLIYVLLGIIGLPVFAGGTGGINSVFSPSFGYLLGFILAAFIIGKISEKAGKLTLIKSFIICIIGTITIYLIGIPYLYIILHNVLGEKITIAYAIKIGFVLFIPGDIFKIIVVAFITNKVVPLLRRQSLIGSK
ncbi:biotin transporter BioY [Clostridium akagii]|uniref:biotin transporter BioY n=1 Tax=Clostridium akagii TaxID=91623 RepID=UPI003100CDB6